MNKTEKADKQSSRKIENEMQKHPTLRRRILRLKRKKKLTYKEENYVIRFLRTVVSPSFVLSLLRSQMEEEGLSDSDISVNRTTRRQLSGATKLSYDASS
ncbi:hypothetical protein Csa_001740 [Cucumis sativus]|uniref:Uncharacterized protein n=1 Tax=Cucumis sativus TaxID=3659 RepID=A0A0A0LAB8_CUCSA|nr:hypothetical protein Csa_001740 [Cucumis sativus]